MNPDLRNFTPLLSLGGLPPMDAGEDFPVVGEMETWLREATVPSTLWLRGPPGSGRSTAVAAAIRRTGGAGRHAKRIACWSGSTLEEVLEEASVFLQQVGSTALSVVLHQRSRLEAKVAVLFQALEECPLILWLDDFDALLLETADRGWVRTDVVEHFLAGCCTLSGRAGRIILTSDEEIDVADECAFALKRIEGAGFAAGSAVDLAGAVQRLSPAALAVLEAAAMLPPEPSRQALREAAAALGVELSLRPDVDDAPLTELAALKLAYLPPRAPGGAWDGPPVVVPGAVRRQIESSLRQDAPQLWKALHASIGAYFLRLGAKSGALWHFLAGWRGFHLGELHEQAYEAQKTFLEVLIHRGYVHLAQQVLESTVQTTSGPARAVAMGNLAIIHKNDGELDLALELYGQVKSEFMASGDAANVARVLHQIGNTHYVKGDHAAALKSYLDSLTLSEDLGDAGVAIATRIQIANVRFQLGEREEALASYELALGEARAGGNATLVAAVELQIGQIHLQERRYVEAEAHLREAAATSRACNDLRQLLKALEALCMVARERREYDLARVSCDEALATAQALGDSVEAAAAQTLAGDVEKDRLQFVEAVRCYERARSLLASQVVKGTTAAPDRQAIEQRIDERLQSIAVDVGQEAFARLTRVARGP